MRRAAGAPPPGRGPAVCGRRSSDWDRPTAPMPVWATCSAAPDRSCTERSWRPATGRTSTGQSRGDDRRPCALLKLDSAERRDPDRCAGQDAVRGQALPGRLHGRLAVVDVVGRHHHVDDDGDRPDHHDAPTTAAVIFHRLVKRRRPVAPRRSGPSGTSALGSPGSPLFTGGSVLRDSCNIRGARTALREAFTPASRFAVSAFFLENGVSRGELSGRCALGRRAL